MRTDFDGRERRRRGGWATFAALLLAALLVSSAASAQQQQLRLTVSSGQLVQFPRPARSVFIADPAIADVQVPARDSVIVFGRKAGRTTLFAIGEDDKPVAAIEVIVGYDLSSVAAAVHEQLPKTSVDLKSSPSGVIIDGTVPDAATSNEVQEIVTRYVGEKDTVVNQLQVTGSQQVNLRVRVAEVNRTVTKDLGINWQAVVSPGAFSFGLLTGTSQFLAGGAAGAVPGATATLNPPSGIQNLIGLPGTGLPAGTSPVEPYESFTNLNTGRATVNNLIDALADEGLVTILAEPNLTATSGQTASFLAGGEFPIPVAQSSNGGAGGSASITVEFKEFGVGLDFIPTVLSSDRISLRVRPEVSQLNTTGAIAVAGFSIPSLTVRRAETTIELGSGQSFAIAGLIQNNTDVDINKYPGLGDIPVLGTLFRSSSFQHSESELVIIVTPYVVRAVSEGPSLKLPTDGFAPASDVERIFLDRLTNKPSSPSPSGSSSSSPGAATQLGAGGVRLQGDAGFIVE